MKVLSLNSLLEFKWHMWRFQQVPKGFWSKKSNQRMHFDWLAEELNIETQQQWYELTVYDITRRDGYGLLASVYHSVSSSFHHALKFIYDEYEWHHFLFGQVPQGLWAESKNRKDFFDWYAEEHGIHQSFDWYDVVFQNEKRSQRVLDNLYGGSLFLALQNVYPQYVWYDWLFDKNLKGYWLLPVNQRKYCDWLAEQLGIETQMDWYQLRLSDFRDRRANSLLFHHNFSIR
jgi:hypothetical protein